MKPATHPKSLITRNRDYFSAGLLCLVRLSFGGILITSCAQPWHEVHPLQVKQLEQRVNDSRTLILSASPKDAELMMRLHRLPPDKTRELVIGSAAPVASDGWFLTANHVVTGSSAQQLVVIYNVGGTQRYGRARVAWQDARADLALVKAAMATPTFYHFTPADRDLPAGTQILHAGITTGNKAQIGELSERVPGHGTAGFQHTLRLAPGDSGGPVILFSGELVGVNSAVGVVAALDTTFFSSSRSSRPDPDKLQKIMNRESHPSS